MSPQAVAGMTSDMKAGRKANNQNRLRANIAAAFDVSDMREAITKTPLPVKRIPTQKSLVPALSTIQRKIVTGRSSINIACEEDLLPGTGPNSFVGTVVQAHSSPQPNGFSWKLSPCRIHHDHASSALPLTENADSAPHPPRSATRVTGLRKAASLRPRGR